MITVRRTLKHTLTDAEVKARADQAYAHYCDKYPQFSPKMIWSDDNSVATVTFTVLTLPIRSTWAFNPRPYVIDIEVQVPGLLVAWKDKAIEVIDRESEKWLKI